MLPLVQLSRPPNNEHDFSGTKYMIHHERIAKELTSGMYSLVLDVVEHHGPCDCFCEWH